MGNWLRTLFRVSLFWCQWVKLSGSEGVTMDQLWKMWLRFSMLRICLPNWRMGKKQVTRQTKALYSSFKEKKHCRQSRASHNRTREKIMMKMTKINPSQLTLTQPFYYNKNGPWLWSNHNQVTYVNKSLLLFLLNNDV